MGKTQRVIRRTKQLIKSVPYLAIPPYRGMAYLKPLHRAGVPYLPYLAIPLTKLLRKLQTKLLRKLGENESNPLPSSFPGSL